MKTDATIFVVDDDASMRKSLLWLLRSAGWHAEAYASAEEFLARPPFIGTGCLVLDVRMPHLTGPDLRDRLAACQSSLPIIFLTGHGDVPTGVDAMKKGAVDFLLKPVDDQVLLQAVQRAVEQHQRAQGHAREMGIRLWCQVAHRHVQRLAHGGSEQERLDGHQHEGGLEDRLCLWERMI